MATYTNPPTGHQLGRLVSQLETNLSGLTDDDLEKITERQLVQTVCSQLGVDSASLDGHARDEIRATIQRFIDSRVAEATPTKPSSQQPLAKRPKSSKAASPSAAALEAKWSGPHQRPAAAVDGDGDDAAEQRRPSSGAKAERGGAAGAAPAGGGGGATLLERVLGHLSSLPADSPGLDAPRIAAALKVPKSDVNKMLYAIERSRRVLKSSDQKPLWRINLDAPAGDLPPLPASAAGGARGAGAAAASGPSSAFPPLELGGKKRLTVSVFGGKARADIREWYEKDGEMKPGSKGISLPKEQWEILAGHIGAIGEALGLGGDGGGAGEQEEEEEDQ